MCPENSNLPLCLLGFWDFQNVVFGVFEKNQMLHFGSPKKGFFAAYLCINMHISISKWSSQPISDINDNNLRYSMRSDLS